jgi:hypothetical protein
LREFLWVGHTVGNLSLHSDLLEVSSYFLKNEWDIDTANGNKYQGGGWCKTEERQSRTFAHNPATAEL